MIIVKLIIRLFLQSENIIYIHIIQDEFMFNDEAAHVMETS